MALSALTLAIHGAIGICSRTCRYLNTANDLHNRYGNNCLSLLLLRRDPQHFFRMTEKGARVYSNPTVYDTYHKDFESKGVPSGQAAWVERARAVAAILAQDAPQILIISLPLRRYRCSNLLDCSRSLDRKNTAVAAKHGTRATRSFARLRKAMAPLECF